MVNPLFSHLILSFFLSLPLRRRPAISGSSSRLVGIQTIYANNGTTEVLGCTTSSANIPVSWRFTRRSPLSLPPSLPLSLTSISACFPFVYFSRPFFAVSQLPPRPARRIASITLREYIISRLFDYVGGRFSQARRWILVE